MITDGSQPIGNGIGPVLEARDVMRVLHNDPAAPADLREKSLRLAGRVIEFDPDVRGGDGWRIARDILESGRALAQMEAIIDAQGRRASLPPLGELTHEVNAERRGIVGHRQPAPGAHCPPGRRAAGQRRRGGSAAQGRRAVAAGQALYRIHARYPADLSFARDMAVARQRLQVARRPEPPDERQPGAGLRAGLRRRARHGGCVGPGAGGAAGADRASPLSRRRAEAASAGRTAARVVLLRSLHRPNEKLVELLIAAPAARELGAQHLSLVCPYLAYMRQDIAFSPGEAVSQRQSAACWPAASTPYSRWTLTCTASPRCGEVMPGCRARVVVGRRADRRVGRAAGESTPADRPGRGVGAMGARGGTGLLTGGRPCMLPEAAPRRSRRAGHVAGGLDCRGRAVVLVDDMASTGRTLGATARLVLAAGAASVDVAVTHALFVGNALDELRAPAWAGSGVPTACHTRATPSAWCRCWRKHFDRAEPRVRPPAAEKEDRRETAGGCHSVSPSIAWIRAPASVAWRGSVRPSYRVLLRARCRRPRAFARHKQSPGLFVPGFTPPASAFGHRLLLALRRTRQPGLTLCTTAVVAARTQDCPAAPWPRAAGDWLPQVKEETPAVRMASGDTEVAGYPPPSASLRPWRRCRSDQGGLWHRSRRARSHPVSLLIECEADSDPVKGAELR